MSKYPAPPPNRTPRPSTNELLQQGLALHQSGRGAEAAAFYERVLAREPQQPAANHLLGLVRLQQGKAEEAVKLLARAVRADPRNAQYLGNLGVALNAAGEHEKAIDALDRAIAAKPDFAEAHANRGLALRALSRFGEAAASHRQAIRLKPNEPGFHFNLANALADDGRLWDAEAAYRRAIELRPHYPAAVAALVSLLVRTGRAAEAVTLVDAALQKHPGEPSLHLQRALALRALGQLTEAAAGLGRALELAPDFGEAHLHLSYLVRHEHRDDAIARMEKLASDPGVPDEQRIWANFGLGKALTDLGEHRAAIDAFTEANRLVRQRTSFSLERAVAQLSDELSEFEGAAAPDSGYREARPIFVVGLPRSGKSTVELILTRHPQVAGVGELPTFGRLLGELRQETGGASVSAIAPARLERLGRDYLAEVQRIAPAGMISVDTMPSNFRHTGFISLTLPNARIIWCRRPALDHCVAIFEKYLTSRGYEYASDLDELVAYHAAYVRMMEGWQRLFPGRIHAIDIGAATDESQIVDLLRFCGLTPLPAETAALRSEPQLGDWPAERVARNWADHLAAWRQARPDLWG